MHELSYLEKQIREKKQNKKIYKATVRPIMMYALEIRAETQNSD